MSKTGGVIAAGSRLTAAAGATMLEAGGNAFDAVVAATLTTFIAESVLSTLGGGGFATAHDASTGETFVLDFSTTAPAPPPANATLDFHRTEAGYGGDANEGSGSATEVIYVGRAASAVPGNPAGLLRLHAEHGRLPLVAVAEPAIRACRHGVSLTAEQAATNKTYLEVVTHTPQLQSLYFSDRRWREAGELMIMADLADTLEALVREGARVFYEGALAARIVQDQEAHGGLLTQHDLTSYRTVKRPPLTFRDGDRTAFTPPPPSSGGFLLQLSRMLCRQLGLSKLEPLGADEVEYLAEIQRFTELARADAGAGVLPDPAKVATLTRSHQVAELARRLEQALATRADERPLPQPQKSPSSTTHISCIDTLGNAVALTTSPGYLAGYIVPDTGIVMNNMLGEPDLNPRGFHRYEQGQRVTSMMCPTLVFDRDGPLLAIGSGGGSKLRGAILQVMLRHLDMGIELSAAVHMPRAHFAGEVLHLEPGLPEGVVAALRKKGYQVNQFAAPDLYFGGTHAVGRSAGALIGAGDPRREGSAAVV